MQVLPGGGTQDGEVQKCEGRSRCRQMRQEWQASKCQHTHDAASLASTILVYFPNPFGRADQTWFINMTVPAQKTLMVASLDGAEYALLDSGSGLTSQTIYADDLPLQPRPVSLPILSNATGGSVECIGLRQVRYRLENGEPFVVTWHVANVTNLIISTVLLTSANIEVRRAKNESSMIMDRPGTRTNVVLHKFAKVPCLKLRLDNSVLDSKSKDHGSRQGQETYGNRRN